MQAQHSLSAMHNGIPVACFLFTLAFSYSAIAGIVIGGTRFIVGDGQGRVSIPIKNTSNKPFLITAKVRPATTWEGALSNVELSENIIATPPVLKLNGGKENNVNVIFIQPTKGYSENKESIYQLEIVAIPSGVSESNSLQLAIKSKFKVIFRPSGVKGNPELAYSKLIWGRNNNAINVYNPTPYVVTIHNLKISGKKISDAGVIMPNSSRTFSVCTEKNYCSVTWQSINDYGRVLPEKRARI